MISRNGSTLFVTAGLRDCCRWQDHQVSHPAAQWCTPCRWRARSASDKQVAEFERNYEWTSLLIRRTRPPASAGFGECGYPARQGMVFRQVIPPPAHG
jgi:hypothetical protein